MEMGAGGKEELKGYGEMGLGEWNTMAEHLSRRVTLSGVVRMNNEGGMELQRKKRVTPVRMNYRSKRVKGREYWNGRMERQGKEIEGKEEGWRLL